MRYGGRPIGILRVGRRKSPDLGVRSYPLWYNCVIMAKTKPLWSGLKNLPPLPKRLPRHLFWSPKPGDKLLFVDEIVELTPERRDNVQKNKDPKKA